MRFYRVTHKKINEAPMKQRHEALPQQLHHLFYEENLQLLEKECISLREGADRLVAEEKSYMDNKRNEVYKQLEELIKADQLASEAMIQQITLNVDKLYALKTSGSSNSKAFALHTATSISSNGSNPSTPLPSLGRAG